MKSKKILLVSIFILINVVSNAQQLYFGFRDGINFTSTQQNNKNHLDFNPGSIYGLIGTDVHRNLNMEFRAGYMFGITNNYSGPEFGLYLRPDIIPNKLFLLGGINTHINIPDNPSSISKTIALLGLGVGSNFAEALVAELIFYFPLEKNYVSFSPPGNEPSLRNIIQLNIGLNLGKN